MNKLIQRNRQLKNRKGFTLIELIVVIAILGILAAVLVPQLGGFTAKAEQAQVLTDAAAAATAADALYLEKGSVPTGAEIKALAGVGGEVELSTTSTAIVDSSTIVLFTYTPKVGTKGTAVTRQSTGKFQ